MGLRKQWRSVGAEQPPMQPPDRVSWYTTLIEEWTTQVPHVAVIAEQRVPAWIGPYSSVVGVRHYGSTQVWASSVEEALEGLCNWIYEDVQADLRSVCPGAVAGEVQMEEEPWKVSLCSWRLLIQEWMG
jgi:hypothetical protein